MTRNKVCNNDGYLTIIYKMSLKGDKPNIKMLCLQYGKVYRASFRRGSS